MFSCSQNKILPLNSDLHFSGKNMEKLKYKLDVLNYLKGFSIFTIVLMHLLQHYNIPGFVYKASSFGGAGVHVFILCSGFGLYLSHLKRPLNYVAFIKRRFMKIYVPYIIVIVASFFLLKEADAVRALLSHVFLYKMFIEVYENSFGIQFWFVSTIIQFYLFWPVIVWLHKRKFSVIISLVISLVYATVICQIGLSEQRIWNSFFLQYLWEFSFGMFLAEKYFKKQTDLIPSCKILMCGANLGGGITGVSGLYGGILKNYNDIASLAGYLCFALLLYKVCFKYCGVFQKIGSFSYELYLVHILVFRIVWENSHLI